MIQQQLKVKHTKSGYKVYEIASLIEAGNLMTMQQRIDIGVLCGYERYTPKISIKIGKVKNRETEFSSHENAQEFRFSSIATLNKIIAALQEARLIITEEQRLYNMNNWRI